jgi:predicted SnoaL-like aldol condensation-catalyzing enzyme
MYENAGYNCRLVESYRGHGTMETSGNVIKHFFRMEKEYPQYRGPIYINIDDCGIGGGVTDRLKELQGGEMRKELARMRIVPVNAAAVVPDPDAAKNYDNMTTYMWAQIRELMENKVLSLEDDDETVAQLSCRKYRMTSRGKIVLESKEEMKKRNIDSPDRADALALSLYEQKMFDINALIS